MINVTDKYINLTTTESGAEIRYTLDGTDPSLSSPLYSGTLSLGSDQVLKARTFKSGSPASNITRYFALDICACISRRYESTPVFQLFLSF